MTTADLASLSFDGIPGAARVYVVPGMLAIGEVTVDAGAGETAKSLRNVMFAARAALGVAQPGDPHGTRREPARTLWISSGTEDDPIFDLAPRITSALAACAAEFGLDPAAALAASRYVHNLSEWANGDPIEITDAGLAKIRAEVGTLNQLDAANRPAVLDDGRSNPDWQGPGPCVRLVVFDPLDALLGEGQTINSRPGARRVMTGLSRFAKGAAVAAPVIHHVIASGGKVAGSPAVTNSVRLAFISAPDKSNPSVKVTRKMKANIGAPGDLRYIVAMPSADDTPDGYVPAPFVAFQGEDAAAQSTGDTLRGRIADTAGQDQGTLRQRLRETAAQRPAESAPAATAAAPWRVFRKDMTDAGPGPASYVGASYPGPDEARQAAQADARNGPLSWRTDDQGRHVASVEDTTGQGRHRAYVAYLAS
jgi:hypothetical protein